jgi:hypothetical protein
LPAAVPDAALVSQLEFVVVELAERPLKSPCVLRAVVAVCSSVKARLQRVESGELAAVERFLGLETRDGGPLELYQVVDERLPVEA